MATLRLNDYELPMSSDNWQRAKQTMRFRYVRRTIKTGLQKWFLPFSRRANAIENG